MGKKLDNQKPTIQLVDKLKSQKRKLIIGVLIILIIALITLLFIKIQSPAIGTIINQKQTATTSSTNPTTTNQVKGKYINFTYPSNYKPQIKYQKLPSTLEKYVFTTAPLEGTAAQTNFLAIDVENFTLGNIYENAPYRLRKNNPQDYQLEIRTLNNEKVYIFTKKSGGFEKVAYWLHGNKLATITHTSISAQSDTLNQEFYHLLASFIWKD